MSMCLYCCIPGKPIATNDRHFMLKGSSKFQMSLNACTASSSLKLFI